jgi:hypothetical protein
MAREKPIKGRTASGAHIEVGWLKDRPKPKSARISAKADAVGMVVDNLLNKQPTIDFANPEEVKAHALQAYRIWYPRRAPTPQEIELLVGAFSYLSTPTEEGDHMTTDRENGMNRLKGRATNNDGDPEAPKPKTDQQIAPANLKRIRGIVNFEHTGKE